MQTKTALTVVAVALLVLGAVRCGTSGTSGSSVGGSVAPSAGGTLKLLANTVWPTSSDPAVDYSSEEWQLLHITNDGLVQFRSGGGDAGSMMLPDLATAIPKPTDAGRTYTFTLRPGIRYSDGTPLKASDFLTVMKRQFAIPGPADSFYSGLIGGGNCLRHPSSCDLSKGVVTNDADRTVTFNLTAADPEFLDKLTLPFAFAVPGDTPLKDLGNIPPAGTGPYMWKSVDPRLSAVLVRNPYFKVWNSETQPAGQPNQIDYTFNLPVEQEVTEIENGQADWMYDYPPADRLNEMATRYPSQVHVNPLEAEVYFALNVNIPPFNNLAARRAINYAANRAAYVKAFGGPALGVPTCQVLPPYLPGYQPYCPYTTDPGDGAWHGPDLAKARQLVAQSGTRGAEVAVVGTVDTVGKNLTEQMVSDLNAIGYHATAKLLGYNVQPGYVQNSDNHVQVSLDYWYQDYPQPSDFLNLLYGCRNYHPHSDASPNISGFCDHAIQADMDTALKQGGTDPALANQTWAKADREVTDQAPMVELLTPKMIDFVSKRVRNYVWNRQWDMLMSQLSVN